MVMQIGDTLTIPRLFGPTQASITDISYQRKWGQEVKYISVRFEDGQTQKYRYDDLMQHIAYMKKRGL
jgi:hypothetical protein